MNKYQEAVGDFDKAIQYCQSACHQYYNRRGYCYFKMGKYAQAIADWENMKNIAPSDYTPYWNYIDEARRRVRE